MLDHLRRHAQPWRFVFQLEDRDYYQSLKSILRIVNNRAGKTLTMEKILKM